MTDLSKLQRPDGANLPEKRLGRGPGSGHGKTSGKGHKGHKARTGGGTHPWFEGGQMPLQRRVPKRGFNSHKKDETAEVRLSDLQRISDDAIDLAVLKSTGVVPQLALRAKVILAGEIKRKVALKGLLVSKGARAAIEAAGGSVEAPAPAQPPVAPKGKGGPAAGAKPAPGGATDR